MESRFVCDLPHQSTKRIDLLHDLAFRCATNRRITRKLSNPIRMQRQEPDLEPHPMRGSGSLYTGMTATNHYDICEELFHVET